MDLIFMTPIGFFFVVVAVGMLMASLVAASSRKKTYARMNEFLLQLGTEGRVEGNPRLFGGGLILRSKIRENELELNLVSVGSGKHSKIYSRLRLVPTVPVAGNIRLSRESKLAFLNKMFGMRDIETGDRSFDEFFVVQSDDDCTAMELLDPSIRMRLRQDWEREGLDGWIRLENGAWEHWEPGSFTSQSQVRKHIAGLGFIQLLNTKCHVV